jgi:hypothetical protein
MSLAKNEAGTLRTKYRELKERYSKLIQEIEKWLIKPKSTKTFACAAASPEAFVILP